MKTEFIKLYEELSNLNNEKLRESDAAIDWLKQATITGDYGDNYLRIGMIDSFYGNLDAFENDPEYIRVLRKELEAAGYGLKLIKQTSDKWTIKAAITRGEIFVLEFNMEFNKYSNYWKFKATSRMKGNQKNPIWEHIAAIQGKHSFRRQNYVSPDFTEVRINDFIEKINYFYWTYENHLKDFEDFKKKYSSKKINGNPITIIYSPGNGSTFKPAYLVQENNNYAFAYYFETKSRNWFVEKGDSGRIKPIDESEIFD